MNYYIKCYGVFKCEWIRYITLVYGSEFVVAVHPAICNCLYLKSKLSFKIVSWLESDATKSFIASTAPHAFAVCPRGHRIANLFASFSL